MELLNLRVLQEYKDDKAIFVFKNSAMDIDRAYYNQSIDYRFLYHERFAYGNI